MKYGRVDNRHRGCFLPVLTIALVLFTYIEQVVSLPVDPPSQWPTFPRRHIAALAREGYLRSAANGFKRSISTLAKNGQLPTFRSPYDETDKHEQDDEESQEKRNIASIARMRSYSAMKRNVQALARDGYRVGKGQNNQQNDKRNVQSLARNGLLHKKDETSGDEYYFPFYQNPIPPLSEIDGPYDFNEIYDLQQSINPDMFPPLSQVYKRSAGDPSLDVDDMTQFDYNNNWNLKRGAYGMPVHGLYRPVYVEPSPRAKRYIFGLPDVVDHNDIDESVANDNQNDDKRSVDEIQQESEFRDVFEKRHIGSLARLGLLPSFRFSGGRYSRSGRARLLLPSQELYRKHSADENFGIREYFASPETESVDPDDADISSQAVSPHSHPTGRILHRPLNNDVPNSSAPPIPSPPLPPPNYIDTFAKNRWQPGSKEIPKFYYFRSLKVPYQTSKRYLLIPAVDNILLRKTYRNSSLPSRRKNQ